MKKEIINHLLCLLGYFIFLIVVNRLYQLSYWPLYVGGVVGLFLPYVDHLMYVFIFRPQELTSQRVIQFYKNKQYKEALVLLHDTSQERKDLIFHTVTFQLVFVVLTFWVVSSSGSLFARGLVLSYFLSIVIFNFKKITKGEMILDTVDNSRIYFSAIVLALFIFGFLL